MVRGEVVTNQGLGRPVSSSLNLAKKEKSTSREERLPAINLAGQGARLVRTGPEPGNNGGRPSES